MALEQGKYTWCHDSVLSQIAQFVTSQDTSMTGDTEVYCDAGGRPWTIPPDILLLITSDRPDLVSISCVRKSISIFELTVPFERNIKKDHQYKCHKYAHLAFDLSKLDFSVKFYAVEIGCRGLVSYENSERLHAFLRSIHTLKFKEKDFKQLK